MIDIHSHILPGIDDGPRHTEEALALCGALQLAGVEQAVATPHFYPEEWSVRAVDDIRRAAEELSCSLGETAFSVLPGGEVAFGDGLSDAVKSGKVPFLGSSRCLLLEYPLWQVPLSFDTEIFKLLAAGYRPILAHPERGSSFFRMADRILSLREQGLMLQVTAGSLNGTYGRNAFKAAAMLAAGNAVDIVASDIHPGRECGMREAVKALTSLCGEKAALAAVMTTPAAILEEGCPA